MNTTNFLPKHRFHYRHLTLMILLYVFSCSFPKRAEAMIMCWDVWELYKKPNVIVISGKVVKVSRAFFFFRNSAFIEIDEVIKGKLLRKTLWVDFGRRKYITTEEMLILKEGKRYLLPIRKQFFGYIVACDFWGVRRIDDLNEIEVKQLEDRIRRLRSLDNNKKGNEVLK